MRDDTLSLLCMCGIIVVVSWRVWVKPAGEGVLGYFGGGELETTRSGIGGQGSSSRTLPSLVPMAGTLF